MSDFQGCIPIDPLDFGFLPPMEKPHRGEDLEAKGPQLAKNLRLRHSEIFWGCGNCGNWLVVEDMVCLVCVFVVLLGILCIFLFSFLSLYIDS